MCKVFIPVVVVFLAVAVPSASFAIVLSAPTDVAFTAAYDGSTQRYTQLLPTDFDPHKQYDVVIALHGSGADRWQFATDTRDECRATRDAAANHDMIMICPDYRATTSWMGPAAEADMLQILSNLKNQYNIGKTILTGASMGGTGTLTFTALHPGLIDGASSVNGLANFVGYANFQDQISASFGGTYAQVPDQYTKRSAINSPQSFTMPFAITAGGTDTVVPPTSVLSLYGTVKNTNPKNAKTASFYRPAGGHSTNYVDTAVALEYVIQNAKGIDTNLHPITINTSFEYQNVSDGSTASTVDGWTIAGSAGIAHLSDAEYAAKFDGAIPDGQQAAVVTGISAIYQFLGTTVRAGTYHLSVKVGSPKDNAAVGTFLAGFLTASNDIAETAELAWGDGNAFTSGTGLVAGKWTSIEFDWAVDANSSAIGKYLYLDLYANRENCVFFDQASVTYSPIPEPNALSSAGAGLLGWAVYVWLKKRRAVVEVRNG